MGNLNRLWKDGCSKRAVSLPADNQLFFSLYCVGRWIDRKMDRKMDRWVVAEREGRQREGRT